MYNPLFAITSDEEDTAREIVRYLLQNGSAGLKQAMYGNRGLTVIHSWGNTFEACTDAAWGLRKYLPHILVAYITPEEKEKLRKTKQWNCMEFCKSHTFPALCLYDKTDNTVLTCHVDSEGGMHPARYIVPIKRG